MMAAFFRYRAFKLPGAMRGIFLGVLLFAFGSQSAVMAATGAERVSVRAGLHANFGRMVFDWTIKVGHSVSVKGRTLTIRFDTPVEPVLDSARRVLGPYIAGIKRGRDARVVLVALKDDFKVRSSVVGNHVVVDLLKSGNSARIKPKKSAAKKARPARTRKTQPPTQLGPRSLARRTAPAKSVKPPAATKAAVAAKQKEAGSGLLSVRTGHHKEYGRLVFGWPRKIGFNVERQGQAVTIQFNAPANIDIGALRRQLPSQINAALTRPNTGGLEIGLIVPQEAQLRYFHNNNDVVFDVVTGKKAKAKSAAKKSKKAVASASKRSRSKKRTRKKKKPPTLPFVSVDASSQGKDMRLKFNWRKPVKAAAFRRDSSL